MEKTFSVDELAGSMKEALGNQQQQEFITGMSLPNILQFVEIEQRTCLIEAFSETKGKGFFYFNKGALFDATYEDLEGEAAAIEMMSWDDVQINFKQINNVNMKRRINMELTSLILKGVGGDRDPEDNADEYESQALQQEIENLSSDEIGFDDDFDMDDEWAIAGEFEQIKHEQPTTTKEKGFGMDVQKLNEAIEIEKRDLGEGLLATDIFARSDGQSIAGYNSQPQACALFNKITHDLSETLVGSGFPGLGRYYILDLVDDKMVIVIPLGDYQWGILVDTRKVQLGLLLNVVMPKMINAFEEAITG